MIKRDDMVIFARETLGLSGSVTATLSPLDARGSDRTFYRFAWGKGDSVILIHYDAGRVENTYYADIAFFLRGMRISVPKMIRHDPEHHFMIMEDVGNEDLFSYRDHDQETRRGLYQKTIAVALRLHSIPEKNLPAQGIALMEPFGPALYQFEHDYFLNHFVKGYCGIQPEQAFEVRLKGELSSLGERLCGGKRSLIHRDLQSQNVMIHNGEPVLIDFQGMRFGSPFYDLGSLLYDPYVSISEDEREELLSFYYVLSSQELDWEAFQNSFREASVQRLMQALGAYGFLGMTKGLKSFLDHIPAGLDNLRNAASHVPVLSTLRDLIEVCRVMIKQANT